MGKRREYVRTDDRCFMLNTDLVRECLIKAELSIKVFADDLGMDAHTISKYMKHPESTPLSAITDIADYLVGDAQDLDIRFDRDNFIVFKRPKK